MLFTTVEGLSLDTLSMSETVVLRILSFAQYASQIHHKARDLSLDATCPCQSRWSSFFMSLTGLTALDFSHG